MQDAIRFASDPTWKDAREGYQVTPANVGARIRQVREAKQLSLVDLGKMVGRSSAAVQQWEVGRSEPGLERLFILADQLGVEPFWLIAGAGAKIDPEWLNAMLAKKVRAPSDDEDYVDEDDLIAMPQPPALRGKRTQNRLRGSRVPLIDNFEVTLKSCQIPVHLNAASSEDIFSHFPCSEEAFAFQIPDSRNAPAYELDGVVIIDPAVSPKPLSMILVRVDDEVVFGKYVVNGAEKELRALGEGWPAVRLGPKKLIFRIGGPTRVEDNSGDPVVLGVAVEYTARKRA